MSAPVPWPGSSDESRAYLQAAAHHCACQYDAHTGLRLQTCGPHQVLTEPPVLKRLVFAHRIADRLKAEEQCGPEWPKGERS